MSTLDDEYRTLGKAIRDYYRQRCMTQVANAIRNGRLPRPWSRPCADCGKQADYYDHRNYTHPLDVTAVCHRCNLRRGPAELDPEVVIHHLRWNECMPYQNLRLFRLGTTTFRRPCACCKDGKHFHHSHDENVVEKPVYPTTDVWGKTPY